MINKKVIVLLAVIMVLAMAFSACSQTEVFKEIAEEQSAADARIHAIETSYTVVRTGEEYAGIMYTFPRIEGMTNKSKQADANGHMKRLNTKTTADNDGVRGAIANDYEVLIVNDNLFSIIFPTTLDVDIATRAVVMLVVDHKFIFSIENIFGRAEENPSFADMRAVFEAAGSDPSFTDDEFRKNLVYFEGEDMKDLTLHMTYFTDAAYDITIPFDDVIEYLNEEKYDMFEFAR